jgi:putative ABC transport system permease protein
MIDTLVRDVRYAWRTLRRAPLAAATIVVTVGLGLGLVAAVYTILNAVVFRVDEVRSPHELFSVERVRSAIVEPETFTRADYDALLRETDVFAGAFASTGDVQT